MLKGMTSNKRQKRKEERRGKRESLFCFFDKRKKWKEETEMNQ